MKTKTLLKIQLRNKGIEVLPSCYTSTGVIFSFSLPPETMRKLKKLDLIYGTRKSLFKNLIGSFKFIEKDKTETWYKSNFLKYIKKNKIQLSKSIKTTDYKFNSVHISVEDYEKLKKIANYYRISRSSLVRVLIDSWEEYK